MQPPKLMMYSVTRIIEAMPLSDVIPFFRHSTQLMCIFPIFCKNKQFFPVCFFTETIFDLSRLYGDSVHLNQMLSQ